MTRVEFSINIVALLHQMKLLGEHFLIDFVKRSDEEQYRLWRIGRDENGNKIGDTVTNCDGKNNVSAHQRGLAMDIYFTEEGKLVDPHLGFDHWHQVWEGWGGKKMIEWDKSHFE